MADNKEEKQPPPILEFPARTELANQAKDRMTEVLTKIDDEEALNVRIVDNVDLRAGFFSLLIMILIFALISGVLLAKTGLS